MRIRRRLTLVLVSTTIVTVALALLVTLTIFQHTQQRQLDHELLFAARQKADLITRLGNSALNEPTQIDVDTELDEQVQYLALYSPTGALVSATPNLGSFTPPLQQLVHPQQRAAAVQHVEFSLRGTTLRGILLRVDHEREQASRTLLLAVSRGDIDADSLRLLRLMLGVIAGAALISTVVAWQLGRHLSLGIEMISGVARRVSTGELTARVTKAKEVRDQELRTLSADLDQMIDRLASLVAAGRRFVSHAAHELRSPLAALRGELELALRHPRSEQAYRAAITEALDDTNRLIALAEDLLTLARLEVAGVQAAQTQESLPLLIQEASRLSLLSTKSEVRVTQEVPEMQVRVRARDFSRLLRNLIDNALSHAPPGSEIAVRAKQESGRVIITVRDYGIGIRPEHRERIFEPFFRGDAEREHSGAGLGLAIAREIARAHGGQLSVQDCDGQGACFALELPQSAALPPISSPDLGERP